MKKTYKVNNICESMYEKIETTAQIYGEYVACDFYGIEITYSRLINDIQAAAAGFESIGIKAGDYVTVCLPNIPQVLVTVYALNAIGAVTCMIHPLSTSKEIEYNLKETKSVIAVTMDLFYPEFERLLDNNITLIVTKAADYLNVQKRLAYYIAKGRKIRRVAKRDNVFLWRDIVNSNIKNKNKLNLSKSNLSKSTTVQSSSSHSFSEDETALVLFSGGTTGTPKAVALTNKSMNTLAEQVISQVEPKPGTDSMLCILPAFHGFGLGVCLHSVLSGGGRCILVPRFGADEFSKVILKSKPTYIAGVPTLFRAMIKDIRFKNKEISFLKGVFCGGDKVPEKLIDEFDKFAKAHNAKVSLRVGYGLTECITACSIMPNGTYKKDCVGIPFPHMQFKIVEPGSDVELSIGVSGEICISGPTLMKEYLGREGETEEALKQHNDGKIWLHTGDIGHLDDEGYLYFEYRIKSVIKTAGYSVYPSQIEEVLNSHEDVVESCVVGIPNEYKGEIIKAYLVINDKVVSKEASLEQIRQYTEKHINKISLPKQYEIVDKLPLTKMGKTNYKELISPQGFVSAEV